MINIAWDDIKQAEDDFSSADYNDMITDQKLRAYTETGAGVPTSTPTMVSSIYYDSTNAKFYLASGTASSADWKKVLTQ